MGFEADEQRRAVKDATFNTDLRTGEYPLIEWGWTRDDAIAYTRSVTGTSVGKSACTFCPFTFANKQGRADVFNRYAADPAVGAKTLLMEHLALALNPAQGLVGGRRLIEMVRDQQLDDVVDAFTAVLEDQEHALYDVRRILRPRKTDPTTLGNAARSVRVRPAAAAMCWTGSSECRRPTVKPRASRGPWWARTASCASTSASAGRCSRRSNATSSSPRPSLTGRSTRTSTSGGPRLWPPRGLRRRPPPPRDKWGRRGPALDRPCSSGVGDRGFARAPEVVRGLLTTRRSPAATADPEARSGTRSARRSAPVAGFAIRSGTVAVALGVI